MQETTCTTGRPGFQPWVRKIPWRRAWQPTAVFLPGKSHGQRSLAAYRPWGRKGQTWRNGWSGSRHYAAAESLQSCPTLHDPMDGSPPGSPAPGVLQARTLEWAAIAFPAARVRTHDFDAWEPILEKCWNHSESPSVLSDFWDPMDCIVCRPEYWCG